MVMDFRFSRNYFLYAKIVYILWMRCPVDADSVLKEMILTEMVARTLKNILRFYQRQWMKAKRSTSDQGMRRLGILRLD